MDEVVLRGVETADELQRANDLMSKVHFLDSFEALRWLEGCGDSYPGFRREHNRVALYRGDIVAATRITTDTIRIGEARLKMGGIGWVTTDGRFRGKGFARELLLDTQRYMAINNYHVSMLFGIPNFYHRYGFATALAEYATSVPVLEATSLTHSGYRLRKGKPGDIRALQKIHGLNDAETSCSLIRTAAHMTSLWERWGDVHVLTNPSGKVFAYFLPRRTDEELCIDETGVANRAACAPLLHACAQYAAEEMQARMRFCGPPGHPLIQYLLQYRSTHEMRVTRDQGGMMALANTAEALESMLPEWESRLMRSAAREFRTEVTLLVDGKPFRVRANRGALDVTPGNGKNKVGLTAGELMHLLAGYRYLGEVLSLRRRILTAEAKALLTAMFPKRTPYVWPADRF